MDKRPKGPLSHTCADVQDLTSRQNMNKRIKDILLKKYKENKIRCSGRVSVFCFIDDTRHVNRSKTGKALSRPK